MVGIYKITSPNNRIYIGQSIDIKKRFAKYKSNNKTQIRLKNSFITYGYDNHIFEVIEECNIEELNTRERYWQDFYNVLIDGLNCRLTKTDDKSGKNSDESKLKVSLSKTGKNLGLTPWNKGKKCDNISESLKGIMGGDKNPMFNKNHSEETKQKISIKNTGKTHSKEVNLSKGRNTRLVLCINTGIFYRSYVEASIAYNINNRYLSCMLAGRRTNKTSLIYC